MEKLGGGLLKKWQKRKFELKAETLEWTAEPEVFSFFSFFSFFFLSSFFS